MTIRHITLDTKTELICPICRIYGECSTHCVEVWQNGDRPDHLAKVLKGHANADQMYELLCGKYPTLESCFEGIVAVSWQDDPHSSHQPLFTGELVYGSTQPRKWTALFHQEGPQLLQHYQEFIFSQLNKPQHIQKILRVIRKHERSQQLEKNLSFSEEPQMTLFSLKDPPIIRYGSSFFARETFASLAEIIDPDELMNDIMANLT